MRLLIIEDDQELASALSRGLSQQGYAVDTAADGEEGLYLADVNEYDLLLLDLILPVMDGFEVLRHLRTGNSALPILILTARGRTEERVKGLDFGADDYLVKPCQFEELCARLRALMRRDAKSRSPVLRCKDLALDPASHTAWRGRRRLELTRMEFGVLEYLMRQSGKPVSQEELMEHVWNREANQFSNVVRVHVKSLRQKLSDDARCPTYLETVAGVGYRLISIPGSESTVASSDA